MTGNGGSAEGESNEGAAESDAFAGSAEELAAKETRRKVELFEWADSVLGLNEIELELALDAAVKRFGMSRTALKRIVAACRSEKRSAAAQSPRTTRTTLNTIPPTSRFQIAAYMRRSSMTMAIHFGTGFARRGSIY
jgi:hypothetical protein